MPPLSFTLSVCKFAIHVMISKTTFAVLNAGGSETGSANAYFEKMSVVEIILSIHIPGGGSGNRLICTKPSGPTTFSGTWTVSGVISVPLICLFCMHTSNSRTQFLTYEAIEGKQSFCRISCTNFAMAGCLSAVRCNNCSNNLSNFPAKWTCE